MREIFTDLYNKVLNFFQPAKDEENSKETACNRLKLVLMQDRVHMDPFIMQKMREEMIDILNKYLEIDNDALDLNLAGEGDSVALMFNIPVIRAKSNEEIEEYEKELKERLKKEAEEAEENQEDDEISDKEETSDEDEKTSDKTAETVENNNEPIAEEETSSTKKERKSSKKSEN